MVGDDERYTAAKLFLFRDTASIGVTSSNKPIVDAVTCNSYECLNRIKAIELPIKYGSRNCYSPSDKCECHNENMGGEMQIKKCASFV